MLIKMYFKQIHKVSGQKNLLVYVMQSFTFVNLIRWQTVDWDAVFSPLKVLRIKAHTVSSVNNKTQVLEDHSDGTTYSCNTDSHVRKDIVSTTWYSSVQHSTVYFGLVNPDL